MPIEYLYESLQAGAINDMKQYILEVEYTIVVESCENDPEQVSSNFMAQLTELAPSNDHILGLSVQTFSIPQLRGSSN